MPSNIKKLMFYRDLTLLWQFFLTLSRVHLANDKTLFHLANPKQNLLKRRPKEKIIKYINFGFFITNRLKIKSNCLKSSVITCHLLRKSGIDARISFASKKEGNKIIGHCWVPLIWKKNSIEEYNIIFNYP